MTCACPKTWRLSGASIPPATGEAWFEEEQRTTILILVRGRFRIDLSVGSALLAEPGDYAMWGPRIAHSWRSEEDSVVVTVRWPAVP